MRIVLEILPDTLAPQAVEAYARAYGWRSQAQDGPVGEFAATALAQSIMSTLEQHQGERAANEARSAAVDQVRRAVSIRVV